MTASRHTRNHDFTCSGYDLVEIACPLVSTEVGSCLCVDRLLVATTCKQDRNISDNLQNGYRSMTYIVC